MRSNIKMKTFALLLKVFNFIFQMECLPMEWLHFKILGQRSIDRNISNFLSYSLNGKILAYIFQLSKPVINFTLTLFSLLFSLHRVYCQDSFSFYVGCFFFFFVSRYTYNLIVKNRNYCKNHIATNILKMSPEITKPLTE